MEIEASVLDLLSQHNAKVDSLTRKFNQDDLMFNELRKNEQF